MMEITEEQAYELQNLKGKGALITVGERWVETILFPCGTVVVLQGETRREGSPGGVSEASIGEGYSCLGPISEEQYEALVAKYRR